VEARARALASFGWWLAEGAGDVDR